MRLTAASETPEGFESADGTGLGGGSEVAADEGDGVRESVSVGAAPGGVGVGVAGGDVRGGTVAVTGAALLQAKPAITSMQAIVASRAIPIY